MVTRAHLSIALYSTYVSFLSFGVVNTVGCDLIAGFVCGVCDR